MNLDLILIIIAIISILFLIIVVCFFYRKKKNKGTQKPRTVKSSNKHRNQKDELTYSENKKLDGARVSHRREHRDRIQQEAELKNSRLFEEEKNRRRTQLNQKNHLQLVYSPCSGKVTAFAQSKEEADKIGLSGPGMCIVTNDQKLLSPMDDSKIHRLKEDTIQIKKSTGFHLLMKIETLDHTPLKLDPVLLDGEDVDAGNTIYERRDRNLLQEYHVALTLHDYKKEQLYFIRNLSYVSAGDKIVTMKL